MGEEIDMAYSDRELLARLIECEAGGDGCLREGRACTSTSTTKVASLFTKSILIAFYILLLYVIIDYCLHLFRCYPVLHA